MVHLGFAGLGRRHSGSPGLRRACRRSQPGEAGWRPATRGDSNHVREESEGSLGGATGRLVAGRAPGGHRHRAFPVGMRPGRSRSRASGLCQRSRARRHATTPPDCQRRAVAALDRRRCGRLSRCQRRAPERLCPWHPAIPTRSFGGRPRRFIQARRLERDVRPGDYGRANDASATSSGSVGLRVDQSGSWLSAKRPGLWLFLRVRCDDF